MDIYEIFGHLAKYFGAFVFAGTGIGAISFWLFKVLGTKWVDARFAEQLQMLKSKQDETIRHVQSTIDREIHRAKKLYDSEFTSLSECWRFLRDAYDQSAGTIASFTPGVERLTTEELDRFFVSLGMEAWKQDEIKRKTGSARQADFQKWYEWERYKKIHTAWQAFRNHLDANSIFFADGFSEKFRAIDELISMSNIEFEDRIRHLGTSSPGAHSFENTRRLRSDGEPKMKELEGMVRTRLWSVAREADRPTSA